MLIILNAQSLSTRWTTICCIIDRIYWSRTIACRSQCTPALYMETLLLMMQTGASQHHLLMGRI